MMIGNGLYLTVLAVFLAFSGAALALDVGLAGIMGSKAMLMINGGEPRVIAVGQSVDGVRLISVAGDQVIVEIDGKKRPLRVGQHAVGTVSADGSGKVILTADSRGHFMAMGMINGTSVKFLVDTGATMVSLGASDARRLGIDTSKGQRGMSSTANGMAPVTKVKLDTVRVGDVTLNNVDALIGQTDMPHALLGMSFLNRMEMQRDGGTMTLKKQY
ncbi:MAG: TIGR02281 family clan AA aspartic protease [Rhodocyclaceae bacterium]|nr:TIGR02281 family clan AA aspartic protease [Rhodocyclaceae bacterium]